MTRAKGVVATLPQAGLSITWPPQSFTVQALRERLGYLQKCCFTYTVALAVKDYWLSSIRHLTRPGFQRDMPQYI